MAFLILLIITVYSLNEIIIVILRENAHVTHRGDFFTSSRDQPVKPDMSWGKKKPTKNKTSQQKTKTNNTLQLATFTLS